MAIEIVDFPIKHGGSFHLVSGLVHPSDFSGLTLQKSHVNHWGELTHLRFVGSSPPSTHYTHQFVVIIQNYGLLTLE